MPVSPYTLAQPKVQTTSVVFASPHSGRHYPKAFLAQSVLDEHVIRSSEDAFVDMLIADAPEFGAPFLHAMYPRAYLDLNRASDEIDPAVVENVRSVAHNPRIVSGLGVVPRVVSNGRAIYRGKIPLQQAKDRIENIWRPYHTCLQEMMTSTRARFGKAILLDVHSMPHEAADVMSQRNHARPEVVLGDRFGAAACNDIVERVETIFLNAGLKVNRNAPFAGAYIVQHYGRPSIGQHAIQIEIDRALYMNEQYIRPNGNFRSFKALMRQVVAELADIGCDSLPLAAE